MGDLIVKNVDLFGDTVVAAQDKDGVIWAGVKWFCDGLGLSKDQMRNERRKIQEDLVLSKGGVKFDTPYKRWRTRGVVPETRFCSSLACQNLYHAEYEGEQSEIG